MVKNTFALSSGFQQRCYMPNPLESTTVHDTHILVDFSSFLHMSLVLIKSFALMEKVEHDDSVTLVLRVSACP